MDWEDLKHVAVLAEAGSLSAAARRLKVDHSTVARRVAALEARLGVRLFDRMPRGYTPTAEGEALVERVQRMAEEALAVERLAHVQAGVQAEGGAGAVTGTVRLAAPPVVGSRFLAPRLGSLRARHPGLALELAGDNRSANLTRREADLALRLSQPEGAALVARRVGDLGYGLYSARDHDPPPQERVYLGYDESLDHVPQQQWLYRLAAGRPLVFRSNDLGAVLEATRSGVGAAVLPCFLAAGDPVLVRRDRDGDAPSRPLWLVVHDDLRRSPRVRAVMDWLVERLAAERALLATGTAPPPSPETGGTHGDRTR